MFVRKQVPRTIRVQPRWHSLWVPVGVGCHGGRQAPPVSQPASRWRRGASVPTKVLSQQQAGFSISRQKRCWAAIQCGHVSRAPEPTRSAGLARKTLLPACVLNCMPLADISQNPYLCSQFFRSFQDYKRMGLAEITSLSGRNSELTLQSRLPLPSLQHPCPLWDWLRFKTSKRKASSSSLIPWEEALRRASSFCFVSKPACSLYALWH